MEAANQDFLHQIDSEAPALNAIKERQAALEEEYGKATAQQSAARRDAKRRIKLFSLQHSQYISGKPCPGGLEQAIAQCVLKIIGFSRTDWAELKV